MSDEQTVLSYKIEGIEKILKAIKGKAPQCRVGIIRDHVHRSKGKSHSSQTVAEIGSYHEFGTATIPKRSFLRVPIQENLNKKLKSAGMLGEEQLKEIVRSGTLIPWLQVVGLLALQCVQEAFASEGGGTWPPRKNMGDGHPLLVDTGDLRDSISVEVGS